jgi:hypothetical protein
MASALVQEVIEHLEALPPELQEQVLVFVRQLDPAPLRGVAGKSLLHFANTISKADLELMRRAIEEGCEQVDPNEW